jgi:starvation-inducible DNA-binding protein
MSLLITKNDLPEGTRGVVVALLNQQLADALDLGLQAKQAHWNIRGPEFISLHELFDQTAEAVENYADIMAERAVQLGGLAHGTIQAIVKNSRLPLYDLDAYRRSDHLCALSSALAIFAASARRAIMTAAAAGDADTADVMTQVSRGTDSLLWKVAAHIPDAWESNVDPSENASTPKPARPRRLDDN